MEITYIDETEPTYIYINEDYYRLPDAELKKLDYVDPDIGMSRTKLRSVNNLSL